jgi:hypothetical protein
MGNIAQKLVCNFQGTHALQIEREKVQDNLKPDELKPRMKPRRKRSFVFNYVEALPYKPPRQIIQLFASFMGAVQR